MDLNEMRKKFREKKEQENTSVSSSSETKISSVETEETNNRPTKSGDSSSVSLSDSSYSYERGAKQVTFSCSRLDNSSEETTGQLSICCWVSEKKRDNDNWQNDNYAFVDSFDLGTLEKGYGFPDVYYTYDISDELRETLEIRNKNGQEWHFIFTVNELHEDGNNYIIHTINGPNENEGVSAEESSTSSDSTNLYDLIKQCSFDISIETNWDKRQIEKGSIMWSRLQNICKCVYNVNIENVDEKYHFDIIRYNAGERVPLESVERVLRKFIVKKQISKLVEFCTLGNGYIQNENDVNWIKLIYLSETIFGSSVKKWQMHIQGKTSLEMIVDTIFAKIPYDYKCQPAKQVEQYFN